MNYFTLFNLPQTIKINKKLLEEKFYQLQLMYHPDLYLNSSLIQKKNILKKSIEINTGYKILKNFSDRAIYLLSLNGININEKNMLFNNNKFLLKYFSLYEELNYIKKHANDQKAFNIFNQKIKSEIIRCRNFIEIELDQKNWIKAEKIILELLFFLKIEMNLKK